MMKSANILSIAAVVGLGLGAAALTEVNSACASAVAPAGDAAAARLDVTLAALPAAAVDPSLAGAAAQRAGKGDLQARAGCLDELSPNLATDCLMRVGELPAAPVPTVTMGYKLGESTSVLFRMPASQAAGR